MHILTVEPSRARGLKPHAGASTRYSARRRALTGSRVETLGPGAGHAGGGRVEPSRARGLKHQVYVTGVNEIGRALTGSRVETLKKLIAVFGAPSRALTGSRVETGSSCGGTRRERVEPSRARGLKPRCREAAQPKRRVEPSRARGLKLSQKLVHHDIGRCRALTGSRVETSEPMVITISHFPGRALTGSRVETVSFELQTRDESGSSPHGLAG